MAPLYPEFAPVAIIASLLVLLPLPWHWRARNVATLSMIFWFFVSNVTFAVDAIVWGDNVNLAIPVWCDISKSRSASISFSV
jgi:pheromone a factor receptor